MSVVRTSDEWLSSSRWMAAVHPVTALLLFRPVLTQQPSLSSLLIARYRQAQLVSSSARADRPCGATAPVQEETGREEHVRDLDRRHLACCSLYPPLASTVARAGGPPSDTPTRLAAARHAPEGPRAAPSCDGLAAPLAPSGWGEHGRNVLSTPATRLEVGSSVRAVVMRERLWLVAEWNGPYGAHGESLQEACGSGRRCSPRPPPGKPSTIRCTPELVPSVGPSGTAWGSRGGFISTRYCRNERL